jgi:hypothetical protein
MEELKETTKVVDKWDYRDRNYYLLNNKQPLTYTLPSRHSRRVSLVWFDPDLGYERELRYATNQKSIFVDKQEGNATLKHIVFEKGHLYVPKNKRNLQEFLSHHPHFDLLFTEYVAEKHAEDEVDRLELELDALLVARELDIDQAEAVLRVEIGSKVLNLSSKELRRDLLRFVKRNPQLFMDLVSDENIMLRNFAIKATEAKIIKLDGDQRTFKWASNGRKLMTVPFDENPYSAMAAWFKTDEGLEVYKSIDKKLK